MVTGELREQSRGVCLCSWKPPALETNTNRHKGTDNIEIYLLLSDALSKVQMLSCELEGPPLWTSGLCTDTNPISILCTKTLDPHAEVPDNGKALASRKDCAAPVSLRMRTGCWSDPLPVMETVPSNTNGW